MPELHAFFDKDVFVKLGVRDLWEDCLEALQVNRAYRLAAASPKGCRTTLRRMNIADDLQEAAAQRLTAMAEMVPVVPTELAKDAITNDLFNLMIFNLMIETDGIDAGEAELAIAALRSPFDRRLITGDKRVIRALSENFPSEFGDLLPVIVSFEACLLAICEMRTFEAIHDRLIAARDRDGTPRLALGHDCAADFKTFHAALPSYR